MRKNMEYHQLTFTLDKQVRGKYEMPHTVCIESKNFTEYRFLLVYTLCPWES